MIQKVNDRKPQAKPLKITTRTHAEKDRCSCTYSIFQYITTMASEKYPRCIATISAGFEKGDFLVREEKGQRVYFDFFEEAFNYIAAKGYSRMPKGEEGEWMELMVR